MKEVEEAYILQLHKELTGYSRQAGSFLPGYCNIVGFPNSYNCYINHYYAIWGFLSTVEEFLPTRAILLYVMCCSTSVGNHEYVLVS